MTQQPRATIRDVARVARVGTTTVSRVINGGQLVAPEVRERVEKVIRELRFQPSSAARSLKRERTHTIGLIVPRLTDPFFSNLASVAQSICRARNHILMMSTSLDSEEQAIEELQVFQQQRVDGLLLVPPKQQSKAFQSYCREFQSRTVAIDLPVQGGGFSSVLTDNAAAMRAAAQHLIGHGRKRILFLLSDIALYTMRERTRGYTDAVKAAGLEPLVRDGIETREQAQDAIHTAINGPGSIDAVLTANSTLGTFAFDVMQTHGIDVPSRVAFISFDDFALAGLLQPSVTCVGQPVEEMSRAATELLFRQLQATDHKPRNLKVASELILRRSCGCDETRK